MIPQYNVPIKISVDLTKVYSVPWRIIHNESGLVSNHFYEYMKGIGWRDFTLALGIEKKAIAFIDSSTKTSEEFEELAEQLFDDPDWTELMHIQGLDLGIANVVFALYAFGCFPITSCRGHPLPIGERYPLVVFFARPEVVPLIVGVAAGAGVGLLSQEADSEQSLIVYAKNILDMQRFANGLHKAYSELEFIRQTKIKHPALNIAESKSPKCHTTHSTLDQFC